MQTTYDFLDALELDDSAQERDIRRAYARKLKRIDQETEPAAFQALRDAYETALDWARWKLAQAAGAAPQGAAPDAGAPAAGDDAAPPTQAARIDRNDQAEAEAPPRAAQFGAEVFGRFQAAAAELGAGGKGGDAAAWQAALEARFADDELVNIDARIHFEAYVAAMLASGWRPGHEALFAAAIDAFAWAGDRRRLWQLGQAGRFLDQAIEERQLFDALPAEERKRMRDLTRLLRQDGLPNARRIRAALPDVERMVGRFPAFMHIVASMDNLERWRSLYRASGGAPIPADVAETPPEPVAPKRRFSTWQGILIFLALSALLRALFNYSGGEQAGRGFIPPVAHDAPAPGVPQQVLDRVVPPVRYTPPPRTDVAELEVIYRVFLDADRKVERVQNWQTSGDPGFDQAVGDALLAAKAFPPATPREFQVRYSGRMARKGPPRPTAALDIRPPPLRVTQAMLREHIPPVRFAPMRFARAGKYQVVHSVLLDRQGKVAKVELIESSGDILLDKAVENALRAARPFPPGTADFRFTFSGTLTYKPAPRAEPASEAAPAEPAPEPEPAPEG